MGGEACMDCGSWEEQIYWTRFQYIQFSQFLHAGFDQHLALPEPFSRHLKAKLPGTVTLKGPSGITWNVELTALGDTMFFSHGWEEFVKDHVLREKDLLVFKYNGDSSFDVLMFDGNSLCEKPCSYFVRKCKHKEQDGASQTKRKPLDSCFNVFLASDQDVDEGTSQHKLADDEIDKSPVGQPVISKPKNKKTRMENEVTKLIYTGSSARNEELFFYDEEIEMKPVVGQTSGSLGVMRSTPFMSNRRLITEEEKRNALNLAQAAVSSKGFTVVMRPSHVAGKFYLAVPTGWMNRFLGSLEKQEVTLRINHETWLTKFSYRKSENRGGLTGGWKNFAIENKLQEFDVCAFEPAFLENDSIVLDVSIFRVAEELSPIAVASV